MSGGSGERFAEEEDDSVLRRLFVNRLEGIEQGALALPERERSEAAGEGAGGRRRGDVAHHFLRKTDGALPEGIGVEGKRLLGIFRFFFRAFAVAGMFAVGAGDLRQLLFDHGQQFFTAHAAEGEEEEGIAVELLAEEEVNSGAVFARVGGIGAGALGFEVAFGGGIEGEALLLENFFDIRRHFAGQEAGGKDGLFREAAGDF